MSYPGAGAPPDGVVPDLEHPHESLKIVSYVTQVLTLVFGTAFVGLRYYARRKLFGAAWAPEDYATYIAYALLLGYCVVGVFVTYYGGGLDQWEVPKENIESFFKTGYVATIFYAPMALFMKLALLLIIARIFGQVYIKTVTGIYVFMFLLVGYYFSGLIIKIRICWPISAYWEGDSSKCLDQAAILMADSIISVVSDLAILLLPTPLTWSLQIPTKKKLRVIGLLCAGGTATAFSLYRLVLVITEGSTTNQTSFFIKIILSGNAEAGIGLICACLPAIAAFILKRDQPTYYSRSKSNSKGVSHGGHGTRTGGQILVSRTFHVSTAQGQKQQEEEFELNHDQAKLVYNKHHTSNVHIRQATDSTQDLVAEV